MPIFEYELDQHYDFHFTTQTASTGSPTAATGIPTFQTFEGGATHDVVDSGITTKMNADLATAMYQVCSELTAVKGFEVGKRYTILVDATVAGILAEGLVGEFIVVDADVVREDVWSDLRGGYLDNIATTVAKEGADGDTLETLSDQLDAVALEGADGDTLETLSDQIDGTSTHTAANVWAVGARTLTSVAGLGLATLANQTTILARIGGVAGAGVNTLLGFFRALMNKASGATPTDIGGTYSAAADSTEAIRDRGDAAWTTGSVAPTVEEIDTELTSEHGDGAWNRGWNMAVEVQNTTLTVTGGLIDGDGHIWLTRDDDHDIDITLTDASGVAINISADTLYLTCRESDEETSTTDADAVFQVLGTVTSGVNGQARFEVGKTQTDECTLNRHYYYDICLIAAHGDVITPIKGRLTNTGDSTRRTA